MQLAKYTNREEKKKEKKKRKKRKERREGKRVRKACVNPSRRTYPLREYSNRNPFDRERRLLPNPSIGFNGHRYSNLYSTRGSRSSLHPFSQPVEATFAPSQRRITVRRIQLLGSTRGRKEKGWNLHSVFSLSLFSLFFSPFASFVCAACMISFRRRYSRNWSGNDAGRCKETFDPSSSSSAPCDRFPSILRKVSSRDRNRLRGGE